LNRCPSWFARSEIVDYKEARKAGIIKDGRMEWWNIEIE
jgi:hypothetical protein